jgi:hypothetical protein
MAIKSGFRNGIPVIIIFFLGALGDHETTKTSPIINEYGIFFLFKGTHYGLTSPIKASRHGLFQRGGQSAAALDSAANFYCVLTRYVEIIRQDDPVAPQLGVALGFEFDALHAEYPYTPSNAVLQLKDFSWGGVEFSETDTLNFTGISNAISEDLTVEIDSFQNNIISGRFSGLLLNGSGQMTNIDSGYFNIKLYKR